MPDDEEPVIKPQNKNHFLKGLEVENTLEAEDQLEEINPTGIKRDKRGLSHLRPLNDIKSRASVGPILLHDMNPSTENAYDAMYKTHGTFTVA